MTAERVPIVTAIQMAAVDRIMIEEGGVGGIQLMEMAGYGIAVGVRRHLGGTVAGARVTILAGTGGNGGDGLVAARFLANWGARPTILTVKPVTDYTGLTAQHLRTAAWLEIPIIEPDGEQVTAAAHDALTANDVIVDGLLGFSLQGNPRGVPGTLILLANAAEAPVVAIDLPSGLNATTGEIGTPCIEAALTVTLAAPKTGFLEEEARQVCGEVWVADIGVPARVFAQVGTEVVGGAGERSGVLRRWLPEEVR